MTAVADAVGVEADQLVVDHLALVDVLVGRMVARTPPGVDADGLRSAGQVGLLDAARTFDPSRGVPFPAYARRRVWGAMLDELRAADWVPRRVRARARQADAADAARAAALPAAEAMRAAASAVSREAQLVRMVPLPDTMDVPGGVDPQQVADDRALVDLVHHAVASLPDPERQVVVGLYFHDVSFADMAARLGVSESRVSQVRSRGVAMLRAALAAAGEEGLAPVDVGGRRSAKVFAKVVADTAVRSAAATPPPVPPVQPLAGGSVVTARRAYAAVR